MQSNLTVQFLLPAPALMATFSRRSFSAAHALGARRRLDNEVAYVNELDARGRQAIGQDAGTAERRPQPAPAAGRVRLGRAPDLYDPPTAVTRAGQVSQQAVQRFI